MADVLELLRQCTVRLSIHGVSGYGTGFFVAPGLIITCAHVIMQNTLPVTVFWQRQDYVAEVLNLPGDPGIDLALLKLTEPIPDHPCVYFAEGVQVYEIVQIRDDFYSFGYSDEYRNGDSSSSEYEGPTGDDPPLLRFKGSQIRPGFSGAPLLNQNTGAVCGIISLSRDISTDMGGRAIPSTVILSQFSELTQLQKQFHQKDKHWIHFLNFRRKPRKNLPGKLPPKLARTLDAAQYFVGRKSEHNLLRKFWDEGGSGLIALVGIGGCGKTAIVQQFLEDQGWLDYSNDAPNGPDGLLVWSFYTEDSTSSFLDEAYQYFSQFLEDYNSFDADQRGSALSLADMLERANGRFLIIMDGLEKLQSGGNHDGLSKGELFDTTLRRFLKRIASGHCGQTKVIITTRFTLTDLATWPQAKRHGRKQPYIKKDVDRLEPASARKLLRKIGVRGRNKELDLLAKEYAYHALTLDLLGRYIVEYHNGDPSVAANLPPLELLSGSPEINKEARDLGRVLYAYEHMLTAPELAAVERLSLFRHPVNFDFLKDVFLGKDKISISGAISALTPREFKTILDRLKSLRLIIVEKDEEGKEFFTSHPTIRDHFYIRLTDPQELHNAVRSRLATLVDTPGYIKPKDPKAIDLIEEVIYHSIRAGRTSEAYKLYGDRLGYIHLGWELGDHARGAGVIKLFNSGSGLNLEGIEKSSRELLIIDYGLYLKNLGRLDEAIQFFGEAATQEKEHQANVGNLALALQNLSAVQVLRGRLRDAEVSARSGLEFAIKAVRENLINDCRVRIATALALQGKVAEAISIFQNVGPLLTRRESKGIRFGWLLMRLGRVSEAMEILEQTREVAEHSGFGIICARANILIAELAFRAGRAEEAWRATDDVLTWAKKRFDQEMFIAADLVSARLAMMEEHPMRAKAFARDGMGEAEEWGYSIYWIALKTVEGRANLALNDPKSAENCATKALLGQKRRRSKVFGAKSNECGYLWGQADALELRALAHLSLENITEAISDLIEVKQIRANLQDPKLGETEMLLENLNRS